MVNRDQTGKMSVDSNSGKGSNRVTQRPEMSAGKRGEKLTERTIGPTPGIILATKGPSR